MKCILEGHGLIRQWQLLACAADGTEFVYLMIFRQVFASRWRYVALIQVQRHYLIQWCDRAGLAVVRITFTPPSPKKHENSELCKYSHTILSNVLLVRSALNVREYVHPFFQFSTTAFTDRALVTGLTGRWRLFILVSAFYIFFCFW